MTFWNYIARYRDKGPESVRLSMLPIEEYRQIISDVAEKSLGSKGWARGRGLEWSRRTNLTWGEGIIRLQTLKSEDLSAAWGIRLAFVPQSRPPSKRRGPRGGPALDLSYDPLDYERDTTTWALGRHASRRELREDTLALLERVHSEAKRWLRCCSDIEDLLDCFEQKKAKQALCFGFYNYPYEVLAYGVTLGLADRKGEGREEIGRALEDLRYSATEESALKTKIEDLWASGHGV